MKYLILLLFIFSCSFHIFGQYEQLVDTKEKKQLVKEQRIEEKKKQLQENIDLTKKLLEAQRFVLKADYLTDNRGNKAYVNVSSNFIMIDSLSAIIQTSSNYAMGYNGVGGITLEGRVIQYKLTERVRKNSVIYNISSAISTSLGFFDIYFTISESGFANAGISGITSGRINFSGKIYQIKKSRIYIGNSYP